MMIDIQEDRELTQLMTPYVADFSTRWTEFSDSRMHWIIGGSGPPLVLLHGDYGSWLHWILTLPRLSTRFTVYAADIPGFGLSSISVPFSEQAAAAIIRSHLSDLVAPDDVYRLAGFSFGGIVAGHLAALEAQRVSHLVISGPGGLNASHTAGVPELERTPKGARDNDAIMAQQRNLAKLMIADPERADELAARIHIYNIEHTRVRAWDIPATTTLLDVMPRISSKVGAIWGGEDRYSDSLTATESESNMRRYHPDLKFEVIDGAGHWIPYEDPERFCEALLRML